MKKTSRVISTLALTLMALGTVTSAHAALKAFSPSLTFDGTPPPRAGGMPTWFQGQDGVAVAPCQVAGCGLLPAAPGTFTGAFPMVFPTNFPAESFYFLAQSNKLIPMAPGIAVDVFAALEYTTIDPLNLANPGISPLTAGVVMATFQRLRIAVTVPLGTTVPSGTWTVLHPWGTTTFDAVTDCKNKAGGCQMTRDIPVPAPNDFAGTLGLVNNPAVPSPAFSMDTFLKSSLAPAGFLGDALTPAPFTGGTVRQFFQVTGPPGAGTTGPITLAAITGKTIGMDVQPGINPNLGASLITSPGTPSAPKTITITNATANSITFPILAAVPVTVGDPIDFAILPPVAPAVNCSGSAVAAGATCSFNITFTPLPNPAATAASRNATITLTPTLTVAVVGATPPPPVTLNLSGTAHVKVVTAVATPHGAITQDIAVDPATGGVPAGTLVTFTVTPHNKKFKLLSIDDGGVLLGTPPGTPPFTLNTGSVNHTVTAAFMQSGDLDADGTLGVADAMKALRIVAGVQAADADDPNNSAVKVAPLDAAGKPAPLLDPAVPANLGIGDVLVILRRVLNLDTW